MIESIEVTHHRLELDPPFPAAWDPEPRRGFPVAVVQVYDSSGAVGIGAGDPVRGLIDYEHLFIGTDPLDLDRHSAVLENISFLDGRPWPFELALWDLAGKISGSPVWKMLGGVDPRIRTYASFGTHRSASDTAEAARRVVEEGFGALKLRFGRSRVAEDLVVLDAVRDAVGMDVEIMVDCNQGWRMPWDTRPPVRYDQAAELASELSERSVYWMEEPLHRGDHAGMARLRTEADVRIAGGEMTRELHEFDLLLAAGALDVYQPDAAVTGGIGALQRVAKAVHDAGCLFSPHTWGSGIALVANAHLVVGCGGTPFLEFPYDPPEWTVDRRDFLLTRPTPAVGEVVLSDRPGLGIELDRATMAATRVDVARY